MDYQKIAGDILFGGDVLDNVARGAFIEAVSYDALCRHDATLGLPNRWHHVGMGWGPWDLQRGSAVKEDRVRFQVKCKAKLQLWEDRGTTFSYSLGWKASKEVPKYFETDFDQELIGQCEPTGYRTDFFLLALHDRGKQSDPNTYKYCVVPTAETDGKKQLAVATLLKRASCEFAELPAELNRVADAFLSSRGAPCAP